MKYGRQKTGILESERGNDKMQLGIGNHLATIPMPIELKTLQLIKHLRRNLVPLLRVRVKLATYKYNMNR